MISGVIIAVVSVLIFLPNETMPSFEWGEAVANLSVAFSKVLSVVPKKPTSKAGKTALRAEIRTKSI